MLSKLILAVLAASTAAVNVRQTEERTLIHPERREQLNKIKAMATTWTAKAGRWAREAPGASAPVLGHLGDNKLNVAAAKERGEVTEFVPKLVNPIPDSFDSAKEWPKCAKLINDIRDQSNCGCCGEPASKIWPERQRIMIFTQAGRSRVLKLHRTACASRRTARRISRSRRRTCASIRT
jgi:hypothetical protein